MIPVQVCVDDKINVGDRLIFEDMAIYSMVKNNTFNGMPLPSISVMKKNGETEIIKKFGYKDFKDENEVIWTVNAEGVIQWNLRAIW